MSSTSLRRPALRRAARPSWVGRAARIALIVLVAALDLVTAVWAWSMFTTGLWLIGSIVVLVVAMISVAALRVKAIALRWLLPTLAFMLAFALAPIVYTGYVALTDYNGTHLLTKQQALSALARQTYVPKSATDYSWAAYEKSDGKLAIFLVPGSGGSSDLFAPQGAAAVEGTPGQGVFGTADADGFPTTIAGYTRLNPIQKVQQINDLTAAIYGAAPTTYRVTSASVASPIKNQYRIDGSTVTDVTTGTVYRPSAEGYFTSADGARIKPAFQHVIGFTNLGRLFGDPAVRAPFLGILGWTVAFAVLVVAIQFAISLLYAVVLESAFVRPRIARVVRSVLLLPYVIPAYLMILMWASLFNGVTGLIPSVLHTVLGIDPGWIGTSAGARAAMLFVGIWLGFPYFLLINTGALQAIPADLVEAASVDGANAWRRFRTIVFPLLMRQIAPLVVLAFAFNFNNFYIAYLLFGGGPPQADAQVPAGDTDLLISFTYKLSFGANGNDYALAAMVTSLIFIALTPIVLSQLRYYNAWRKED